MKAKIILKIIYNLIRIGINHVKIAWNRLMMVFPLEFILKLPGYLIVGIIFSIGVIFKKTQYEDVLNLIVSLKSNRLTEEQIQYVKRANTYATHISWWFWIFVLITILY